MSDRTEEEAALQMFHDDILKAYRACLVGGPGGKKMSNFFFGQKLRRLVREALEAYGNTP